MRLLLIMAMLALSAQAELKTRSFLDALAMKETGTGWNGEPGPCGELSRWQITATTWQEEMGAEPFSNARNIARARVCALRRIARLQQLGCATPERIATCWHYGPSHRWRASVWGQEVENLYNAISK